MDIIIDTDTGTDNITTVTASSEDAAFPAANLRDDFTTNLWKAASGMTATLTVLLTKGSAIELLNTNAVSVAVTAGSGETYSNETGYSNETDYAYSEDSVMIEDLIYNLPGSGGRLWITYPEFSGSHVVTIALTTASGVPSAGIIRGGKVESFPDPPYDMEEESLDFSIEAEMNNGADYFRKRNVVRTFEGLSFYDTRANAWKFKHKIFDSVGPKPLAIRLVSQAAVVTDDEFILFARRIDPPRISHTTSYKSTCSYNLREVI